ncbi:MAG: nuclear transport factor 2 family protein [Pseudomonadota bacterium]
MSAEKNHETLARRLFDALQAADAEAIEGMLAHSFAGTQNGGPAMDAAALITFAQAVKRAVPDFRYEAIACRATTDGFVEEHLVCGTAPDGTAFRIPLCVVGDVEGAQISALREYVDTRAATPLLKALG